MSRKFPRPRSPSQTRKCPRILFHIHIQRIHPTRYKQAVAFDKRSLKLEIPLSLNPKLKAKQHLEAQSIKYAIDKLAATTSQTELENSVQHATAHPYWHPEHDHRAKLLELLSEAIAIIRSQLETISPPK